MEAEQKYLSLSEAAALTPYSSSYLSFLARKGKLRSIKEGDTWFTTKEWVLDYLNFIGEHPRKINKEEQKAVESGIPNNYITSAQAERIFPYSSSYFSLRIRQGKLKGEKIGNKWFTTAEWINEYIAQYGEKGNSELQSAIGGSVTPDPIRPVLTEPQKFRNSVQPNSFKIPEFSFLRPAAIGLTVITVLILAGPPKIMARWVYDPLAIAYRETIGTIGSLSSLLAADDDNGQVAGESVKFKN